MDRPVIAISTSSFGDLSREPLERLAARGFDVRTNPHGRKLSPDESRVHVRGAVGLIAGTEELRAPLLRELSGLRVISRVGVGVDNIDHDAARELGIAVRFTPTAHVDAVAELALGGILAALRRIPTADRGVRGGKFPRPMGGLLRGRTLGLVGLGRVGKALVQLVQPFSLRILAHEPTPDREFAAAHRIEMVSLAEVLAESDVVSLHLPYSKQVHHIIGAAELARMKPEALLVNTARGGLVDEDALLSHLRAHSGASAYLDCFVKEPYSGPLAELDNVVLTTHIGSYANECRAQMETEAVDNLLEALTSRG